MGEFIHYVTDFYPGIQGAALVVGVPHEKKIWQIGLKRSWPQGHMQTIRGVLKKWKAGKGTSFDPASVSPYSQSQVFYQPMYQPMNYQSFGYSMPRFSFRGGGC